MSEPNVILATALETQNNLRFSSGIALLFPVMVLVGISMGFIGWPVFIPAACSLGFVFYIYIHKYGNIRRWWWIRRGTIVVLKDHMRLADARLWLYESPHECFEIHPTVFKFYKKSAAVHFKLTWG